MGWQLGSHGHSHGGGGGGGHVHGHGHSENINVRAAFIHVIGDMLQSIGVFCAALVIYFYPTWKLADPICTFIFSVVVLFTTITILKDTLLVSSIKILRFVTLINKNPHVAMQVLMEGTPTYLDYSEMQEIFLSIDGVRRVHNLRIWGLSINKVALSAHLAIGNICYKKLSFALSYAVCHFRSFRRPGYDSEHCSDSSSRQVQLV